MTTLASGAAPAPVDESPVGDRGRSSAGPLVTPSSLTVLVFGVPAPQGSKSGFAIKKGGRYTGKVAMNESSKKVKPWRQDVVAATQTTIEDWSTSWANVMWIPLDGPLHVRMVFSFVRPKSHYRTGRNAHLLRDDAPVQPCSIPDLSKLARSTEDALTTAGAWKDDARVAEYDRLAKVWCGEDPEALATTGCRIEIRAAAA